jgi:hypothetical protein
MSEGKYCLQKLISEDKEKLLKVWKNTNNCSDDIITLKDMCPYGYRIVDTETDKIAYEPE